MNSPNPKLADLEAPILDLSSDVAPEIFLGRLRKQNRALEHLRLALACEDRGEAAEFCLAAG